MDKLTWFFLSQVQRMGMLRIAGMLSMLAALMLFIQTEKVDAETRVLEGEMQTLPKTIQATDPASSIRVSLPQGNEHALKLAAELQKLADDQGLFVERTDYRFEHSPTLNAYHIDLPLKGDYPNVRAFLDKALSSHAALALQGLHLSREDIKSRNIDARLRFTLYMR